MEDFKGRFNFESKVITITHKERGIVTIDTLNSVFSVDSLNSKYDNLTKFFINYSFGGNSLNRSIFSSMEYEDKKEGKYIREYLYFFRRFTSMCSSRYYSYRKSNIGNIYSDFLNFKYLSEKKKGHKDNYDRVTDTYLDEPFDKVEATDSDVYDYYSLISAKNKSYLYYIDFKKYVQKLYDLLSNDLNLDVSYMSFLAFSVPKFRKDVRKLLVKHNVKITSELTNIASKDKDFFNNTILILDSEKLFTYFEVNYGDNHVELRDMVYNYEDFKELIKMNYDLKSIILNFYNYFGVYENLDFHNYLNLLRDYAEMNVKMKISKYKKYPKYLKSNHDIIVNEYSNYKKTFNEKTFYDNIDHNLQFKNKNFMIVSPKCTDELKKEGEKLSHCVGSYISRIIEGRTQIFFLRVKDDESLVTIELRDNTIIQAKGYGNRAITKIEKSYLETFSKKLGLLLRV